MIRLLHLADLHLGRPFQMLGEKGAAQRRALEAALIRAVDLAIAERVHLVLVAGDLFDSPKPAPALIELAAKELRRLDDARIRVAVVGGNHDAGPDGYVAGWEQLRRANPNALFFGPSVATHVLADLDLALTGRSPEPGTATSPLEGWPQSRTTTFAVGLTHGSCYRAGVVEGSSVMHPQEIRALGLDYLALGDWHSTLEVHGPPHPAWYAGSPELLAYDQEGAGHVLLVDLAAPGQARVTPQRIGRRRYVRLDMDLATNDDTAVRKAIESHADPDTVCDAILSGLVPVSRIVTARALEEEFGGAFFRLRVTNRTHVWLDDAQLAEVPEDTVLGRFVRVMRARIAEAPEDRRSLLQESLQVGVAVLQGREVLG
jgi:DNA repair exonuclease SbcCD nuclease subunit